MRNLVHSAALQAARPARLIILSEPDSAGDAIIMGPGWQRRPSCCGPIARRPATPLPSSAVRMAGSTRPPDSTWAALGPTRPACTARARSSGRSGWYMGCVIPTFRLGWSSLHPRKAPASPLERLPSAVPCSFSRHPHSARPAALACLSRRSRSKWRLLAHSTTLLDARRELVASRSHVISPDSARGSQEACRPAVEPARGPQVVPRTRWAAHYPSAPAEGSARLVACWQVPLTARRERHR